MCVSPHSLLAHNHTCLKCNGSTAILWSFSAGYHKFVSSQISWWWWARDAAGHVPLSLYTNLCSSGLSGSYHSWALILDKKCWTTNQMCYLLCCYIHLLPSLPFCSLLNASLLRSLLAVKCTLYFSWRRKSLKPRCHMFNAIKRSLTCVNLSVLYCMHLGGACVDVPYLETIHYLSLSYSTEK